MIITEEDYLTHHGVKGMKWGVRKQQAANAARAVGRGAKTAAAVTGVGVRKAVKFSKAHPKTAAFIAAGALFTAARLATKINGTKIAKQSVKMEAKNLKRATMLGSSWTQKSMSNQTGLAKSIGKGLFKEAGMVLIPKQ